MCARALAFVCSRIKRFKNNAVGVISIPEIIQHKVTKEDELLVLASDGVWEFIDNDEVASKFGS